MNDECESEDRGIWCRRMVPTDFVVLGLHLAEGIGAAFTDTFRAARGVFAAHANWQTSQREFRAEAAKAIERIVGDE